MRGKIKFKKTEIINFILPFIIITVVFFVIGSVTVNSINNHYYEIKKLEAIKLARSYSHNLTKSDKAADILNKFLDDKLRVAGKTTILYNGNPSNELLTELANTLEVDEIDYYSPDGELIYSNIKELVGWKVYKGHPIHDFMMSNEVSLIEDIRQDVITGLYYKYGYTKFPDGSFIQVGVRAEKIKSFLSNFEMQRLIIEMGENQDITQICYIDNNFYVTESTNNEAVGKEINSLEAKAEILENREYGYINDKDGEEIYQVFVPLIYDENRVGALSIKYSLKDTEKYVKQVTVIGLFSLIIIYSSLLYTMISGYKKNMRLVHLAYYDLMTELPNKQFLKEWLHEDLCKRESNKKAILLINCYNFRNVNMTFGYEYGDEVIKSLSKRLKHFVGFNVMVFRFAADRFVLYVKDYNDKNELKALSKKICDIYNQPIIVNGVKLYLIAQIGIIEINDKTDNIDQLLKYATIALSNIRNCDICNCSFYNKEMETNIYREKLIEIELRTAIDDKDDSKLFLEYQPQVDLRTNKVVGFEVLARMESDQFGTISPLEFIDIAERKYMIVSLSNIIFSKSCEFSKKLYKLGFDDVKIAVNISGIQLLNEDFVRTVINTIKETGVDESKLEIEITESILLKNFSNINEKLKELQKLNIQIAIDDFGTGYSSLFRLRELNVDSLKIDRYFINDIANREKNELITGDIISMAHKLGLKVVAEGVELQMQKDYLIEKDCDIIQGYLVSKPLKEKDAIEYLKTNMA